MNEDTKQNNTDTNDQGQSGPKSKGGSASRDPRSSSQPRDKKGRFTDDGQYLVEDE